MCTNHLNLAQLNTPQGCSILESHFIQNVYEFCAHTFPKKIL